jgi:hypothetical protein
MLDAPRWSDTRLDRTAGRCSDFGRRAMLRIGRIIGTEFDPNAGSFFADHTNCRSESFNILVGLKPDVSAVPTVSFGHREPSATVGMPEFGRNR